MTQSLVKQIADLKKRIEATKGTPAEATFQDILKDLESQLAQGAQGEEAPTTAQTNISTPATSESTTSGKEDAKQKNFFQAVGQLRGVVRRKEDKTGWYLEQGQNQYDLALTKKLQYVAHFIEEKDLTLTVYPQVKYEKGDRENCKIYFKLVGWTEEKTGTEGLFTIRGIWQFIPQYKRPVISVYRNEKHWDGDRCKAGHIPVLWKDSSLKPFKFNPKAETQGEKYFVQVQAKFIPRLNTFGVVQETGEASIKVPKYIRPIRAENPAELGRGEEKKKYSPKSNSDYNSSHKKPGSFSTDHRIKPPESTIPEKIEEKLTPEPTQTINHQNETQTVIIAEELSPVAQEPTPPVKRKGKK